LEALAAVETEMPSLLEPGLESFLKQLEMLGI